MAHFLLELSILLCDCLCARHESSSGTAAAAPSHVSTAFTTSASVASAAASTAPMTPGQTRRVLSMELWTGTAILVAVVARILSALDGGLGTPGGDEEWFPADATAPRNKAVRVEPMRWSATVPTKAIHPLLLKGSPMEKWNCHSRWDAEYLAKASGNRTFDFLSSGTHEFWYWNRGKPLEKVSRLSAPHPVRWLSMQDFFTSDANLSAVFALLHPDGQTEWAELLDDVEPRDFLRGYRFFLNLRFSTSGATTRAHFDEDANLIVQVRGWKRWQLFPPSSVLDYYPFLHPLRSQIRTDEVAPPGAQEVLLEPGSVLFIPPLWFHSVHSGPAAVSLNIWLHPEGEEAGLRTAVEALPLPFEDDWPAEALEAAVRLFARAVVARLHLPAVHTVLRRQYADLSTSEAACPWPSLRPDVQHVEGSPHVARVAAALEALRARGVGVLEAVVLTYLERMANAFVEQERLPFFMLCLAGDMPTLARSDGAMLRPDE